MTIYTYDKSQGKVVERKPKDNAPFDLLPAPSFDFQEHLETLEYCRRLMLGYPLEPTK
jgi:hypothetical protein